MYRRVNLLGAPVDIVTQAEVLAFVESVASAGQKALVANQNLHSLALLRRDPDLRAFFDAADMIEIDSMPLVHWAKLLGLRLSHQHRCTYLDWRDAFWGIASQRRWRVFLLGGERAVNRSARAELAVKWPGVRLAGHDGFFDKTAAGAENAAVLEQINTFRPHILLVGMGMPLQEVWIRNNYPALRTGVVLPVGGAFDYEAGTQKPAPRILGRFCLEWAFRLAHEPLRLSGRYLVEPWSLAAPALADLRSRMMAKKPPMRVDVPALTDRSAEVGQEARAERALQRAA